MTLGFGTAPQEERASPSDDLAVLQQRGVDEFDTTALALNRRLDRHRGNGHRAQEINRQSSRLKVIVPIAIAIQCPAQQPADDLTAHRLAPRSTGHGSGHIGIAVGGEECIHPLMLGSPLGDRCALVRAQRSELHHVSRAADDREAIQLKPMRPLVK